MELLFTLIRFWSFSFQTLFCSLLVGYRESLGKLKDTLKNPIKSEKKESDNEQENVIPGRDNTEGSTKRKHIKERGLKYVKRFKKIQ